MAGTDWEAAIAALNAGELPCSSGERRLLLLAASIAGGIPVSLYDTLPGIDQPQRPPRHQGHRPRDRASRAIHETDATVI